MASASEKFTNYLVRTNTIREEDKELYTFGIQQGSFMLFNLATTVFIGLLFGMAWQVLLFSIAYLSLRSYSGGYHASTQKRCYIFSMAITISFLALLSWSRDWPSTAFFGVGILATTFILFRAPVENEKKPLDSQERSVYKKRTQVILFCQGCVASACYFTHNNEAFSAIILSIAFVSVMLLIAKAQKSIE